MSEANLLHDPVEQSANSIAFTLLKRTERRARRLVKEPPSEAVSEEAEAEEASPESEALHDFRVALRRLRSHLGAYRDHLDKRVAGKLRKSLKSIMDQTSQDRDSQVHHDWLARRLARSRVPQLERAGLELLVAQLPVPREHGDEYDAIVAAFDTTDAALRKRLKASRKAGAKKGRSPTFGVVAGDMVHRIGVKLGTQLEAITSPDDEEASHQARLTAKKLRYLLEPLADDVLKSRQLVRDLKNLQDLLGNVHDLHTLEMQGTRVFRETVKLWRTMLESKAEGGATLSSLSSGTPELHDCYAAAAVVRRLHLEQASLHRRLVARWQGDHAKAFFDRLDVVAGSLHAGGSDD